MKESIKPKRTSMYLLLMIVFLLVVNISLGYLLLSQSRDAIVTLMQTRMLDISNTAAAMIDGDTLKSVSPDDEGTEGYESIMRTLTHFQDNIDLKYIYCIRDMGDGTFTFGLDPTVEDPGEFGSPIVYTDALYKASKGMPATDEEHYEDAWGAFYSAYSPVFDSEGKVAGIIAVDFSAAWYNEQLVTLTWTIVIVALVSLLVGGGIVVAIVARSQKRIGNIHGQLNELESTLMQEMGGPSSKHHEAIHDQHDEHISIDTLGRQIQSLQAELQTQIARMHGQAYQDGLTGLKNKKAYLEMEQALNERLGTGALPSFSIVVCDINGLKIINDTLGHKAGDEYIHKASDMLRGIFSQSPVYRIGGDEFVIILTDNDFEIRKALMHELHKRSLAHISTHEAVVSGGLADYVPHQDQSIHEVFERADATMYEEKMLLKSLGAATRDVDSEHASDDLSLEDILVNNVKKNILITDDTQINREILGDLLEDDYGILYASDGVEALQILRDRKNDVALLILDLQMPNMTGREVLTEMQVDPDLMSIPVLVITVDQEAELECLKLGAMDFIPKPYPDIEIVKARVSKCIELSENRDLIRKTQHDKLTGLFNMDYFIRYVNLYDQQNKDAVLDAIVCDVHQFDSVNERYGTHYGDFVLRSIGASMKRLARQTNGFGCRRGVTFLLYCPHRDDYEQLLSKSMDDYYLGTEASDKASMKFGVYANANQEPDIAERFACAQIAADSIRNDPQRMVGFYNLTQPSGTLDS